jgi:hypothetical protein
MAMPDIAAHLLTIADEQYPGYPVNLAKNATECERVSGMVLEKLHEQTA